METYSNAVRSGHAPVRAHPRRQAWRLDLFVLAALLGATAVADDYDALMADAGGTDVVSALVTGWRPITGDETDVGSDGTGLVAITGDEFVDDLQAASNRVAVTRRYENFPVMAMEMDADALRRAKAYGAGVEVWQDAERYPTLRESTRLVGVGDAWQAGYRGKGLAVVVIDTGVDRRHPFLRGRVAFEGCFASRCPNGQRAMVGPGAAAPVHPHGTHVAGIVLGRSRADDLYGVGPDLNLIAFNVANPGSAGMMDSSILAALDVTLRLAAAGTAIGAVNMSLGSSRRTSGVCRSGIYDLAANLFSRARIPVVVASGNDGKANRTAPVGFPACIDGFISVGAVNKSRRVATFSNSGRILDLLAPGVDIRSSVPTRGGYDEMDGTSMAAPHVAGAIALLKQAAPTASVQRLVQALKSSGHSVRDSRNGVSAPLIDIGAALRQFGAATDTAPPKRDRPDEQAPPAKEPDKPKPPPSVDQPFTVATDPASARVRIMNIVERYRPGIELPAGSYRVEASAPGYETKLETVRHGSSSPTLHRVTLHRKPDPPAKDDTPDETAPEEEDAWRSITE